MKNRCRFCIACDVIDTTCKKCKELNEFDALMSGDATELTKVDLGQAVTPEEKGALWSEDDESRMDVIGSNGNDGAAYAQTYGIEQARKVITGSGSGN